MKLQKQKLDVDEIDEDFELDESEILANDLNIEEKEKYLNEIGKN